MELDEKSVTGPRVGRLSSTPLKPDPFLGQAYLMGNLILFSPQESVWFLPGF